MKVKELIERLNSFDPEADVQIAYYEESPDAYFEGRDSESSIEAVGRMGTYDPTIYICSYSRADEINNLTKE